MVLQVSRWVLRSLIVLNVVAGSVLLLVLAWSFVDPRSFLDAALRLDPTARTAQFLTGFRIAFAAVPPATIAAHFLFTRLLAILDSVAEGQTFAAINAERLRVAAWALLVVQLSDLLFGYGATMADMAAGERTSGWSPGITGWVAVLLIFVLARVFREGARLRDDAELTI